MRSKSESARRGRKNRQGRRGNRPIAEGLELRRMLTAVTVTGTSAAQAITVGISGSNITVTIGLGSTQFYSDAAYDSISVNGNGGADSIYINADSDNPVTVSDPDGSDTVYVGGGNTAGILSGITSPVTVADSSATDTVYASDSANTVSRTFDLTNTVIKWDNNASHQITYNPAVNAIVLGGSYDDTFIIDSAITGSRRVLFVEGQGGNDQMKYLGTSLLAADKVQFDAGTGSDYVFLTDTGTTGSFPVYRVTGTYGGLADDVTGIPFASVENVILNAAPNANIAVFNTSTGEAVTTYLAQSNYIYVGDPNSLTGTLDSYGGTLLVVGGSGTDSVSVLDKGTTVGHTYSYVGNAVTRDGGASPIVTLDSASVESVAVYGGTGNDSLIVGNQNLAGDTIPITYVPGAGTDSLAIQDGTSTYAGTYTIGTSQTLRGAFAINYGSDLERYELDAAAGDNFIYVNAAPGSRNVSPFVYGGGGGDTINFTDLANFKFAGADVNVLSATVDGGTGQNLLNINNSSDSVVGDDGTDGYYFDQNAVSQYYFTGGTPYNAAKIGTSNLYIRQLFAGNVPNGYQFYCNTAPFRDYIIGGGQTDTFNIFGSPVGVPIFLFPSAGNDVLNVNLDGVDPASALINGSYTFASIHVGGGGIVTVASGSHVLVNGGTTTVDSGGEIEVQTSDPASRTALLVGLLTLSTTGIIELHNNDMLIGSIGLSTLVSALSTGYANGTWTGTSGIRSVDAGQPASRGLYALGYTRVTANTFFDGVLLGPGNTVVKYTYTGDANLDGKVDGSDYTKIDNGYTTHTTGWSTGDFNYDNLIDGSDYSLIDNAYNRQAAAVPAAMIATQTGSHIQSVSAAVDQRRKKPAAFNKLMRAPLN